MFGILLTGAATLFEEISSSIGKRKVAAHQEGPYTMGFLTYLGALVLMLLLTFMTPQDYFLPGFPDGFHFDPASLPTFILKTLLDMVLSVATTFAVLRADRSTFGFLRTITIPLLLCVDLVLGYHLSVLQMLGICLITVSLLLLFVERGLSARGSLLTIFAALLAVATISLYKFNIENFNSVGAEQTLSLAVLVSFFFILAQRAGEKPLSVRRHPFFLTQALFSGLASASMSFAYLYAPASVISAARRGLAVFWAVLSGNHFFHEKHLVLKLTCAALLCCGTTALLL